MKYSIYQLKQTEVGKSLLYLTYDEAKTKINANNYEKIWEGEIDSKNPLQDICTELAKELPAGYYGHVPTVSDVIVLEDGTAHYIDVIGYKQIGF